MTESKGPVTHVGKVELSRLFVRRALDSAWVPVTPANLHEIHVNRNALRYLKGDQRAVEASANGWSITEGGVCKVFHPHKASPFTNLQAALEHVK